MLNAIFKTIAAELIDIDEKDGIVKHVWSHFGNKDSHGDIIMPGAYADTIKQHGPSGSDRIKFLWQHDWWVPIGRPMELTETETGLEVTTKISATRQGRDALVLYADGVLTEHSVGISDLVRNEDDTAEIIKVGRLWEGSVVTWGANSLTPFLGMKSEQSRDAALDRMLKHTENIERVLSKAAISTETGEQLQLALTIMNAEIKELQNGLGNDGIPSTAKEAEGEEISLLGILDNAIEEAAQWPRL